MTQAEIIIMVGQMTQAELAMVLGAIARRLSENGTGGVAPIKVAVPDGSFFKRTRTRLGMLLKQMAPELGVSVAYLSELEIS